MQGVGLDTPTTTTTSTGFGWIPFVFLGSLAVGAFFGYATVSKYSERAGSWLLGKK